MLIVAPTEMWGNENTNRLQTSQILKSPNAPLTSNGTHRRRRVGLSSFGSRFGSVRCFRINSLIHFSALSLNLCTFAWKCYSHTYMSPVLLYKSLWQVPQFYTLARLRSNETDQKQTILYLAYHAKLQNICRSHYTTV